MTQTPQNRSTQEVNSSPTVVAATHVLRNGEWQAFAPALKVVSAEFQRPADVLAYNTFDVISNSTVTTSLMEFDFGDVGSIVKARLVTNNAAATAQVRLYLYASQAPSGIAADNAPHQLRWANRALRLGHIDFPSLSSTGAGSDSAAALVDYVELAIHAPKVWGVLVTMNSWTPVSGQSFFVELTVKQ